MSSKPSTEEPIASQEKNATKADEAQAEKKEDKKPTTGNKYGDDEEEESKIVLENKKEVKSGEEDEELIYIHRAKIYRFRDGKWKERGSGYVKLLRSKKNKIRLLLRQEKTKKLAVNFFSKFTSL